MDYQLFFQLPILDNYLLVLSSLEQAILNRSMKIEYSSRADNPSAYVKTKLPLFFGNIVLNCNLFLSDQHPYGISRHLVCQSFDLDLFSIVFLS
jgi:hypothetical protein